jgi:hypothetical protein
MSSICMRDVKLSNLKRELDVILRTRHCCVVYNIAGICKEMCMYIAF